MSKATHAFVLRGPDIEGCGMLFGTGARCALPRSAHPAEPAPEAEIMDIGLEIRYGLIVASDEPYGSEQCGGDCGEPFCSAVGKPEPAPESPDPLRRLAEEWILRRAGLTWHQEALSLTRLLERVVAAAKRGEFGE